MTVPLGALAEAYLDALAGLESDRIGNISGFVAIAGQLILIKSRAMLPRPVDPAKLPPDEPPDPEAALRARLIVYRAHREAGQLLQANALERIGLFRREPAVAAAAARSGAVAEPGPPLDPARLAAAIARMIRVVPPPEPPPETIRRTVTIAQRAELIRAALRGADQVVLQELLRGVRDRVVLVVTFLAMLELDEATRDRRRPGRAVGPDRGPRDDARGTGRRRPGRRADRRDPGVVRVTDPTAIDPIATEPTSAGRPATPVATTRIRPATPEPIGLTEAGLEALLFVAERPLSRREIGTLAGVDRETVDARIGDLEVSLARTGDPAGRLRRPGPAGDRSGGRPADRTVCRRGRDPAVAGRARDHGHRGLSAAGDEGRRRADPWRRFRLHAACPAPSPPDRRARPGRDPGSAVPVRHRLRVPRAVRADEPRRPAAARSRGRRAARRGRGRAGRAGPRRRAADDAPAIDGETAGRSDTGAGVAVGPGPG